MNGCVVNGQGKKVYTNVEILKNIRMFYLRFFHSFLSSTYKYAIRKNIGAALKYTRDLKKTIGKRPRINDENCELVAFVHGR